jgi:hypothetical protein
MVNEQKSTRVGPTISAVEEIAMISPACWARMTGSVAWVTFTAPNLVVSICARKSVAGVVDEDDDPADPLNGGAHRIFCAGETGDIEFDGQRIRRGLQARG